MILDSLFLLIVYYGVEKLRIVKFLPYSFFIWQMLYFPN